MTKDVCPFSHSYRIASQDTESNKDVDVMTSRLKVLPFQALQRRLRRPAILSVLYCIGVWGGCYWKCQVTRGNDSSTLHWNISSGGNGQFGSKNNLCQRKSPREAGPSRESSFRKRKVGDAQAPDWQQQRNRMLGYPGDKKIPLSAY